MFNFILAPLYRIAAIAAVVLAILVAVFRKGQTTAFDSFIKKQNKEAEDAIHKAITARTHVDITPADRVRDNDGYRRD